MIFKWPCFADLAQVGAAGERAADRVDRRVADDQMVVLFRYASFMDIGPALSAFFS
jgi:hypothetical protein